MRATPFSPANDVIVSAPEPATKRRQPDDRSSRIRRATGRATIRIDCFHVRSSSFSSGRQTHVRLIVVCRRFRRRIDSIRLRFRWFARSPARSRGLSAAMNGTRTEQNRKRSACELFVSSSGTRTDARRSLRPAPAAAEAFAALLSMRLMMLWLRAETRAAASKTMDRRADCGRSVALAVCWRARGQLGVFVRRRTSQRFNSKLGRGAQLLICWPDRRTHTHTQCGSGGRLRNGQPSSQRQANSTITITITIRRVARSSPAFRLANPWPRLRRRRRCKRATRIQIHCFWFCFARPPAK